MHKEKEEKSWVQYMRDRAVSGAVFFMLSAGGLFLYNRGMTIWDMPDTVNVLKADHIADSTEHHTDELEKRINKHKQDSINEYNSYWLGVMYKREDSLIGVIKYLKRK